MCIYTYIIDVVKYEVMVLVRQKFQNIWLFLHDSFRLA